MLRVVIGEVIGMEHETRYSRDGAAVVWHKPRRRIKTPVPGFHFPGVGTYHFMRREVVEYPHNDDNFRFRWHSYCGLHWVFLRADGVCTEMSPNDGPAPYCVPCRTCQRRARCLDGANLTLDRAGQNLYQMFGKG